MARVEMYIKKSRALTSPEKGQRYLSHESRGISARMERYISMDEAVYKQGEYISKVCQYISKVYQQEAMQRPPSEKEPGI